MRILSSTLLSVVLLICLDITMAQSPVQLSDMLRIQQAGSVIISPDGTQAYYTVTTIEPDAEKKWEYQYQTQLWTIPVSGSGAARQLTAGRESVSQPALSPDGRQIAFVRQADGKSQLFLLPLSGGEAIQLTRGKYAAYNPVWSPDGRQLAFVSSIPWKDFANDSAVNKGTRQPEWPMEKPGNDSSYLLSSTVIPNPDGSLAEVRAWLQLNEKDKKAKVINRLDFQEESTTSGDLNVNQVFITDIRNPQPKQITSGFNSWSNPQFLNNQVLLVSGKADQHKHPDRVMAMGIYSVRTDGTGLSPFLVKIGYSYSLATISRSGKWIAVLHNNPDTLSIPALSILPANGREADLIPVPVDRAKGSLSWRGDTQLFGTLQSNGGITLFQYDISSRKLTRFGAADEGVNQLAVGNSNLLYSKTKIADPSELYISDLQGQKEKMLTRLNSGWLAQRRLSIPQKHEFLNNRGQTIEYWVMKPLAAAEGAPVDGRYPLLLQIHGGPTAMWGPGENSMWHEFQYWCAKGYGVVYANPRGSGGYGVDFMRANSGDWGAGPMSDVLTALDKTVAEGWADTSRLFLSGGSYAGYLGAYILGHDHRFRAACSQRGVYDLQTFFGEGNAWRLVPWYFGGYPWQPAVKSLLDKESPISYVDQITTPYIIFHGENDLRTGVIQSEQLYKSLKVLQRPVEYVRHPGATHEITRSGNNRQRLDQLLRTWEFFERFR
ncbi:S9 family peptidase [Flavihumibacter petaseus]|uniref:Peptidase S9 family protein n=1 Tax=Flavihumibacter petaseus NBRC 106054 TaxID=1220578 RepID=A0A0E9MXK7_9BACT|nr:S9 family peptidase [Flavihumibacter petaseus]GAO42156.1 peptidase S9 family protein [Flavihumibacter petaseus NBRC 106054]